jgi:germination protein M
MKELKDKKKNKIRRTLLAVVLFIAVFMGACSQGGSKSENDKSEADKTFIYYVDKNETKVEGVEYKSTATTKETQVEEYLDELNTDPGDVTLKRTIPENVTVEKYSFNEDNGLSVYFNSAYNTLTGFSEVLCRAGIVKTLCQIKDVEYVEFYINEQPLMVANEKPLMKADDFIDDTSAENVFVNVYFANEKGKELVSSNLKITSYDGNIPIEKLIVETLLNGPIEDNMIKTIPEGTVLNKISVKDGICYVDFNDNFLNKIKGVKDEVIIYSVVNSLVELSTINKVQFMIDGEPKKFYREDIPFDGLFERNLDIVEGSK